MNNDVKNELIAGFIAKSLTKDDYLLVKDKIENDYDWFNAYLDAKKSLYNFNASSENVASSKTFFKKIYSTPQFFFSTITSFVFLGLLLFNLNSLFFSNSEVESIPLKFISSESDIIEIKLIDEKIKFINNSIDKSYDIYYKSFFIKQLGALDTLEIYNFYSFDNENAFKPYFQGNFQTNNSDLLFYDLSEFIIYDNENNILDLETSR